MRKVTLTRDHLAARVANAVFIPLLYCCCTLFLLLFDMLYWYTWTKGVPFIFSTTTRQCLGWRFEGDIKSLLRHLVFIKGSWNPPLSAQV